MLKPIQFDELAANIKKVQDFIQRNAEKSAKTTAGRTSDFWNDIFHSRGNFPDLNQLMVCRRQGNSDGVDMTPRASVEEERIYNGEVYHQFRRMVPVDYVASMPESTFGSPFVFENAGITRSASFWINAGTSYRVLEFVKRFGSTRSLRILEIGAGVGMCAYQLHLKADCESYTIVDLPENIYLSTLNLSTILPDREVELLDMDGEKITAFKKGTINFCLPGTISRIDAKYDLVLNSFSMQEMTIENVRAYIDWIESVLSDDGIFVSLNSHAKAGVEHPQHYRFGNFHIHHWGVFRQNPIGYFNTIPYEVVIGKRRADSPNYPVQAQDAIGWLIQLGLDGDIRPYCDGLVAGTLGEKDLALLKCYDEFFHGGSDTAREQSLAAAEKLDSTAVLPFVKGLFHLARDEITQCRDLLEEACRRGLKDFALVKAGVILAAIARRDGKTIPIRSIENLDVAIAYPEAYGIAQRGELDQLIAYTNRTMRRTFARSLLKRGIGRFKRMMRGAA